MNWIVALSFAIPVVAPIVTYIVVRRRTLAGWGKFGFGRKVQTPEALRR